MKYIVLMVLTALVSACGNLQNADSSAAPQASAPEPIYEIEQINGDLYRARSNNHYTLFRVFDAGVVLADPLNLDFAEWLKSELATRFNEEVVYVLYSHHHWDHASGGAAFLDTAEFVGHENMLKHLQAPLPSNMVVLDGNNDQMIQRSEATGGTLASFDILDANSDGALTGAEINANIVMPTITYTDRYPVYISGWEVSMIHAGNNHSDDGTIINFGEEATAYGVDWLNVRRLPGGLAGQPVSAWLDTIDRMLALPITRVIPGHGEHGLKADLVEYRQFFVDLDTAAREAIAAGVSQQDFQENISLPAYADWGRYDTHLGVNAASFYEMAMQD